MVLGAAAEEVLERVDLHGARAGRVRPLGGGPVGIARLPGWPPLEGAEAVVVCLGDQPRLSARRSGG